MPPVRALPLIALLLAAACQRAPSREVALQAIRVANPSLDSTAVIDTVWTDGPPWFSCAEVLAKVAGTADSAVVRNQVGNWKALILADWASVRDTAAAPVAEPGWCVATVKDSAARGWTRIHGDSLPTRSLRRGWQVNAGHYRIGMKDEPTRTGKDSAEATWYRTVDANENGKALGADKDSLRQRAVLIHVDGQWVVR